MSGGPVSITRYAYLCIIIIAIMFILIYINYNTTFTETYNESKNLRIDIANILRKLPLSYFSKHSTSDISQTFISDIETIEHALSHAIPQIFGLLLFLFFSVVSMYVMQPVLAFIVLTPIIISLVLLILSKKNQINGTTRYYNQLRNNSKEFQEAIDLQLEIKSYGQSQTVKNHLYNVMDSSERIHIKTESSQAVPLLLSSSILKFSLGLTVYFGSILYLQGSLSLLILIAFIVGSSKLVFVIDTAYEFIAEIMYLDARLKNIAKIRKNQTKSGEKAHINEFDITFKNVNFSYVNSINIINNLSFTAKQNEVTALVGPSGCGKTTITRLISKLYDYNSGSILVGGEEIKNLDTEFLFDKISIVFQDVILFNTSVFENIRMGRKEASSKDVYDAANKANCLYFIENLPEGFDTIMGENGTQLSGGQRQRISIARALLKNAPIVLLDEISSALDVENELNIQQSLNELLKNKTVIIISHRLKSIESADKIIVLNHGTVDCIGKHDTLLDSSQLYHSLVEKSEATTQYQY